MNITDRSWTLQYWNLMMTEKYEEAFPLKYQHFPSSFFKYRSLTDYTLTSLEENTLWLAQISTLNDPFECSLQFDHDNCLRHFYGSQRFQQSFNGLEDKKLTNDEIKRLTTGADPYAEYLLICKTRGTYIKDSAEDFSKKILNRVSEIIDESNDNIRVSCFSEYNDSLLMWPHYADQHKGICIEYDLLDEGPFRSYLHPIVYSDRVFKLELLEDFTILKKVGSSLIKSKEWEYEGEWRLVSMKQSPDALPDKIPIPAPKAIYLSTRFHQNDTAKKEKLLSLTKKSNIPVYQMVRHNTEFKLTVSSSVRL